MFASELNCLKGLCHCRWKKIICIHYLRLGSFYRELTPYKNVTELTAGTFLIVDCNTLQIQQTRWWNIHEFYLKENNDSFEESIA